MAFYQGISQRTAPGYHRIMPFHGLSPRTAGGYHRLTPFHGFGGAVAGFGDVPSLLQAPGTPGGGTIDGQAAPGLGLDMTSITWQAPPIPGAQPLVVDPNAPAPSPGSTPDLLARPADTSTPWLLIAGLGVLLYAMRG